MPFASLLSPSLPLSSPLRCPNSPLFLHRSPPLVSIANPKIACVHFLPFSTRRSRDRIVSSCSPMAGPVDESAAAEESLSQDFLSYARAYWVTRYLIAWNADDDETSVWLYASRKAQLFVTSEGIEGQEVKFQLEPEPCGLPENVVQKFPHIKDYKAFHVPHSVDVGHLVKCQLAVVSFGGSLDLPLKRKLPAAVFLYDAKKRLLSAPGENCSSLCSTCANPVVLPPPSSTAVVQDFQRTYVRRRRSMSDVDQSISDTRAS